MDDINSAVLPTQEECIKIGDLAELIRRAAHGLAMGAYQNEGKQVGLGLRGEFGELEILLKLNG